MIRLQNVSKVFEGDDHPAVRNISVSIAKGEFVFVTGPSGAGKTTLIRLMHGDLAPDSGEIIVNGHSPATLSSRDLAYFRREVTVVHQDPRYIPRKSAQDNVALALEVAGVPRKRALESAEEALARVGLLHHRDAAAVTLSGGETQRMTLARALVVSPAVLIADEPTGNLDQDMSDGVFAILHKANSLGITVVIATHDARRIELEKRRVLMLEDGSLVSS